jgi:hypothetical protein
MLFDYAGAKPRPQWADLKLQGMSLHAPASIDAAAQ